MKRKGKTPRYKIQRRLLTELPGLGKSGALERRPYPPGQHGQRRKKYSEYGLQLEEKQKLKYHYGVREAQLLQFVRKAKRSSQTNWVSTLVGLLEKRLDNVIFRLGFAPSIPAARQMVSHGKVMINGKKVNIRSALVKVGDKVQVTEKGQAGQDFMSARQSPRLELADYLKVEEAGNLVSGTVVAEPELSHLPFAFDQGLVTSYFSSVKS